MKKMDIFKTRISIDDRVYLLASDVRKALGFANVEALSQDYPDIVKTIHGLPKLVLETDFNTILLSNKNAIEKLMHVEMTRIETLRFQTESIKSIYPLKFLFAGEMFKQKARQAGYVNVNEYIEKVDFVEEIESVKNKFLHKSDLKKSFEENKRKLNELVDYNILKKYGLKIEQYIHIKDCTPYLESFIVGVGIFFCVYDYDYAFDMLKVENNDLIIPTSEDYEDDFVEKNYGHDPDLRDYRKYSTLENIIYILEHKPVQDAGVDLLMCEASGISFYISQTEAIKLYNPNMYREMTLVDGCAEFEYTKMITSEQA